MGPPLVPKVIENYLRILHEEERLWLLANRRCARWHSDVGLLSMDLADMQGLEKARHSILLVFGASELHQISVDMSIGMNVTPDFTGWLETVQDPAPGYAEPPIPRRS